MKAGTQQACAQFWSLKLEQGHVLAMLGQKWECCAAAKVVFDLGPVSVKCFPLTSSPSLVSVENHAF